MGAEGGKDLHLDHSAQRGLDPRRCDPFYKKHLLSTHGQCARNHWTSGPGLSVMLAAPLLSL